ncbi:hypothetical protein A5725_19945 [Mycobacterium kubicae]|nr:hypothetical protein A5725_19945 [Mycobacterium kubicae]
MRQKKKDSIREVYILLNIFKIQYQFQLILHVFVGNSMELHESFILKKNIIMLIYSIKNKKGCPTDT